jgi:hypothetical protein
MYTEIKAPQRNSGRTDMVYNENFTTATKTTGTTDVLTLFIWKTITQNMNFSGTDPT